MNVLYCVLDANEFNCILTCNSTKEIWDRLEITYKGINQVKESKNNILVHKYKFFKIESDEFITEIFTHFINIINGFKSLNKWSYKKGHLVSTKIMGSNGHSDSKDNGFKYSIFTGVPWISYDPWIEYETVQWRRGQEEENNCS